MSLSRAARDTETQVVGHAFISYKGAFRTSLTFKTLAIFCGRFGAVTRKAPPTHIAPATVFLYWVIPISSLYRDAEHENQISGIPKHIPRCCDLGNRLPPLDNFLDGETNIDVISTTDQGCISNIDVSSNDTWAVFLAVPIWNNSSEVFDILYECRVLGKHHRIVAQRFRMKRVKT